MVSVLPSSEFPDCIGVVADSLTSKVNRDVKTTVGVKSKEKIRDDQVVPITE